MCQNVPLRIGEEYAQNEGLVSVERQTAGVALSIPSDTALRSEDTGGGGSRR